MRVDVSGAIEPFLRDLTDNLTRNASDEGARRDNHAFGNDAAGGDQRLGANLAAAQNDGAHANQTPEADPPAVQDRPVPGDDVALDIQRHAEIGVHDNAVLQVDSWPQRDGCDVAANHDVEPQIRARADRHVADDQRTLSEEKVVDSAHEVRVFHEMQYTDAMKTTIVVCPFANFGSPGSAQGPEALADAIREMLDDVQNEKRSTRGRAFREQVSIEEMKFDTPESVANWRQSARKIARKVLDRGEFLIWLGGNHLSVLPVYEELVRVGSHVLQFDAHLDLYNLDSNKKELNHGNWLRHAEKLPPIANIGHRDLFLTAKAIGDYFTSAHSVADLGIDEFQIVNELQKQFDEVDGLFFDLDCDVLDPAYFPAVTHPMPFGLAPRVLLRLLDVFWTDRVNGVAISEFDPGRDRDERSLQTLVWLIEWMLLAKYE